MYKFIYFFILLFNISNLTGQLRYPYKMRKVTIYAWASSIRTHRPIVLEPFMDSFDSRKKLKEQDLFVKNLYFVNHKQEFSILLDYLNHLPNYVVMQEEDCYNNVRFVCKIYTNSESFSLIIDFGDKEHCTILGVKYRLTTEIIQLLEKYTPKKYL